MKIILNIISSLGVSDARAALYYLNRYLKLAPNQEEYEKEIFDEDERSAPTEEVKSTTFALVEHIERAEGRHASEFGDERYHYWIDQISIAEDTLDPEASPDQKANAEAMIRSMELPPTGVGGV